MSEASHFSWVKYRFLNPIKSFNYITLIFAVLAAISGFLITFSNWSIPFLIIFVITTIVRVFQLTHDRDEFKKPYNEALQGFASKEYFKSVFLKNVYNENFNNDEELNKYSYYKDYVGMIANKSAYFQSPQSYLSELNSYSTQMATQKSKFNYEKCEKDFPGFLDRINQKLFYKVGLLGLAMADNNLAFFKFLKKNNYYKKFDNVYDAKFILQFRRVLEEDQIEFKITEEMAKELTEKEFFNSLRSELRYFILNEIKKVGLNENSLKEAVQECENDANQVHSNSSVAVIEQNVDKNISAFSIDLAQQFNELYQDNNLNAKLNTIVMYQQHLKSFLAEFEKKNANNVSFIEESLFINNNVGQFLTQIKEENDLALQIKKVNIEYFNISKNVTSENLHKKLDALIDKLQTIQNKLTQTLSENLMNMQEVGNKVLSAKA